MKKQCTIFLLFLCFLSGIAYALILHNHHENAPLSRFLMWCPGFAAIVTCLLTKIPLGSLGWRLPARRSLLAAYFVPLLYATPVYAITWLSIHGSFSAKLYESMMPRRSRQNRPMAVTPTKPAKGNRTQNKHCYNPTGMFRASYSAEGLYRFLFLVRRENNGGHRRGMMASQYGLPAWPIFGTLCIALPQLFTITVIGTATWALGEELGWRGFLFPRLQQRLGFHGACLSSGVLWAVWHYPGLLGADYNSGTNPGHLRLFVSQLRIPVM